MPDGRPPLSVKSGWANERSITKQSGTAVNEPSLSKAPGIGVFGIETAFFTHNEKDVTS
ncbi:hypothetical protein OS242_20425 [Tumebacillus sp. DT12]|uniref:Uncharacterized protein n=1 Tax=Tumebacillus lacus TaxID=2995335 RepID=A0ABT3X8G4_9BACL|nr:hypothetical protein [Tumebacillus lacus]MCX7572277.1 hypothetical protein [Tumebacillus lacus]